MGSAAETGEGADAGGMGKWLTKKEREREEMYACSLTKNFLGFGHGLW
jgi:hypothetical protein